MDDEQLRRCLYVSEAGEVKAFPDHASMRPLRETLFVENERRAAWQDQLREADFPYRILAWEPISHFPELVQQALLRLYQEREAAREYAVAFYWSSLPPRTLAGFEKQERLFNSIRQEPWFRDYPPVEEVGGR